MPQNNWMPVVATFITLSVCLSQSSASRDSLAAQTFHQQKRIFCNFYGCGSKRSSLPALGPETRDPQLTELLAEAKRDHMISYQDDFPLMEKASIYDDLFDDDSKMAAAGNALSDVMNASPSAVDPEGLLKKASILSMLRSQIIRRHAAQLKGSK